MLIPRPCSQSPSKIALACSPLAKPEASAVRITTPEPLLAGQRALGHQRRNIVSPKESERAQNLIYTSGSRVWLRFPTCPQAVPHRPLPSADPSFCPAAPGLPGRPRVPAQDALPLKLPVWPDAERSSPLCNGEECQSPSQHHFLLSERLCSLLPAVSAGGVRLRGNCCCETRET